MALETAIPVVQRPERLLEIPNRNLMESVGEIVPEPQPVSEEEVYVAVGKERKESLKTLQWTIQMFRNKKIILLHVHQPSQMIPTPMGNFPANKVKPIEVKAHRNKEQEDVKKLMNDYLALFSTAEVHVDKRVKEADDIQKGIVQAVAQYEIQKLIMGAAADNCYSRKMNAVTSKKAAHVKKHAPLSCMIFFICKGSLICTREPCAEQPSMWMNSPSPTLTPSTSPVISRQSSTGSVRESMNMRNLLSPWFRRRSKSEHLNIDVEESQSSLGGETVSGMGSIDGEAEIQPDLSGTVESRNGANSEEFASCVSFYPDPIEEPVLDSVEENDEEGSLSICPTDGTDDVMQSLHDQLRRSMEESKNLKREALNESVRCRQAEHVALEARCKAKILETKYEGELKLRIELDEVLNRERHKLEDLANQRDKFSKEVQEICKEKDALTCRIAELDQLVHDLTEKLREAEESLSRVSRENVEIQRQREDVLHQLEQYQKREGHSSGQESFCEFSVMELNIATRNFDGRLKIGQGGYGTVYKGRLRHTDVAIKVLDSGSLQGQSEFQQEVNVLSRVRHPNLVTLIGACSENSCLIYEFLPNGNLEERLCRRNDSPALSFQARIRIASEVCSALLFLHSATPHSIVHGDLKPSNILLSTNDSAKIGDFGICRLLEDSGGTLCWRTDPKGTFPYVDPEFLATGDLTHMSDVYSFGVILLQLLTGRSALGIIRDMHRALENGCLTEILDPTAGSWPFVQANQLAHLALRCCEMNRRSRPDLGSEIVRTVELLRATTDGTVVAGQPVGYPDKHGQVPTYFLCPIFQEIMNDPHVAADGFTYEGEALRGWFESDHDTSPMTNLKLPHLNLIPNRALRSAIQEWVQN
ncbi:U-box domain-containing protein 33 [Amborella trichopoda]|uniref:RING-type E3 ubiquitin transferase n=1 Tax=Amborella trichopoda TaxID=13333 RepID=W1NHM8_AMBTC|nr:U-box domain-containing protein 33 [Amborella trichopoda]ERM95008.1 hypothetical protein AMTR_s00009p00235710 [Amborella trichopoda]|eukprot:XP_006827592.1 U-box domain-containing protein 33 [Amborella trichopoda]